MSGLLCAVGLVCSAPPLTIASSAQQATEDRLEVIQLRPDFYVVAGAGANIMLNGFADKALIDNLLGEFGSQYKIRAAYSAADMSRPAEIAAMIEHATRELGSVDILVNNAGRNLLSAGPDCRSPASASRRRSSRPSPCSG